MAKQIWHSELKSLGPVRVTIKSDILKSKWSKPNDPKPDFVVLDVNGEQRNYTLENPSCGDVFRNRKEQTISIIAEGSGESATITYVGQSGAQTPLPAHRQTNQAPPAHQPPPATQQGHDSAKAATNHVKAIRDAVNFVGKNRVFGLIAMRATLSFKLDIEMYCAGLPDGDPNKNFKVDDALFSNMFNCCCYGGGSRGIPDSLPTRFDVATMKAIEKPGTQQAAAPPPPQPPPPPPPPPEPQPDPENDGHDDVPF